MRSIQNNRPNPNQNIVFYNAPMNSSVMANRDAIANKNGIQVALTMYNSAVLHV